MASPLGFSQNGRSNRLQTVVDIVIPPELYQFLHSRRKKKLPFENAEKSLARILKENGITRHSFRRGSIQAMKDSKIPVSTILLFSLHTKKENLYKYMDWAPRSGKTKKASRKAMKKLEKLRRIR